MRLHLVPWEKLSVQINCICWSARLFASATLAGLRVGRLAPQVTGARLLEEAFSLGSEIRRWPARMLPYINRTALLRWCLSHHEPLARRHTA